MSSQSWLSRKSQRTTSSCLSAGCPIEKPEHDPAVPAGSIDTMILRVANAGGATVEAAHGASKVVVSAAERGGKVLGQAARDVKEGVRQAAKRVEGLLKQATTRREGKSLSTVPETDEIIGTVSRSMK